MSRITERINVYKVTVLKGRSLSRYIIFIVRSTYACCVDE